MKIVRASNKNDIIDFLMQIYEKELKIIPAKEKKWLEKALNNTKRDKCSH